MYKDCDIVAFSVYVWNNNISMRIAKALKEVNPNILTLVGGCHIPERPEYIEKYMNDHPYIDIASVGEGERVFTDFLENYPKRTWENVESLIYRDGERINTTADNSYMDFKLKYETEYWLAGIDPETGIRDGSVRTYGTWTGVHTETGKEFKLNAYHAISFKDGKIVGGGDYFDFGGFMASFQD